MSETPEKMQWWHLWNDWSDAPQEVRGSRERAEKEAEHLADVYGTTIYLHRVTDKRVSTHEPPEGGQDAG